MKELKYVHVSGSILLDPTMDDACLPNLEKLSEVSARSCTEIELPPVSDGEDLHCLKLKSNLPKLKSLNYVIVNPSFMSDDVALSFPMSMFPSSLVKLKLSGVGYPWEYTSIIGKLENLKVLKLQCYAFRGLQWNTENGSFRKLDTLWIEDCNLMHWNVKRSSFPALYYLSIKQLYKLKELPYQLSESLMWVKVVDCNPSIEKWSRQMEGRLRSTSDGFSKTDIKIVSHQRRNDTQLCS